MKQELKHGNKHGNSFNEYFHQVLQIQVEKGNSSLNILILSDFITLKVILYYEILIGITSDDSQALIHSLIRVTMPK